MEEILIAPPRFSSGQLTVAQKRGLRFEKKVGSKLGALASSLGAKLFDHPWIAGPLQPDFVLSWPSSLLLIECKLTEVDCSAQFAKYLRTLVCLEKQICCVQICRNLSMKKPVDFLDATPFATIQWWI